MADVVAGQRFAQTEPGTAQFTVCCCTCQLESFQAWTVHTAGATDTAEPPPPPLLIADEGHT